MQQTLRQLYKENKRLLAELEVTDRLYITADTALRPYMETARIKTGEALDWELKAKTYRVAFIVMVCAIVFAMFVIIGLAIFWHR